MLRLPRRPSGGRPGRCGWKPPPGGDPCGSVAAATHPARALVWYRIPSVGSCRGRCVQCACRAFARRVQAFVRVCVCLFECSWVCVCLWPSVRQRDPFASSRFPSLNRFGSLGAGGGGAGCGHQGTRPPACTAPGGSWGAPHDSNAPDSVKRERTFAPSYSYYIHCITSLPRVRDRPLGEVKGKK